MMEDSKTEKIKKVNKMKWEMVYQMMDQIKRLKKIKTKTLDEKNKELSNIKNHYRKEVAKIEKDIYNIKNSIKAVVGVKGLAKAKREMRAARKIEKEKANQQKKQA